MASLIGNLNLQWVFLREAAMRSPTVLKIEAARLKGIVKALDTALAGQEFLLPSGFSAADTMFGFNLWATPRYVRLEAFANVRAYMDRIGARAGHRAAVAAEPAQTFYTQEFYEIG
jgi:glutathione S-transferase